MDIFPQVITSRQNLALQDAGRLTDKKYRDASSTFLLEGEKLVLEAGDRCLPVQAIFVSEEKRDAILSKIEARYGDGMYSHLPVYVVTKTCFSKISTEKAPQGVVAVVKYLDFFKRSTIIYDEDILFLRERRVVMLYAMQDPGNLGAVIRSAVAFGAECIIMSAACADIYNTKTIRAAMGSMFHVRIYVVDDFGRAILAMQKMGRRVLAAELREGAIPLSCADLSRTDCVLIGNEGHGIPTDISEMCNASVYLPITPGAESLNAAVAAGIFMWEQSKR